MNHCNPPLDASSAKRANSPTPSSGKPPSAAVIRKTNTCGGPVGTSCRRSRRLRYSYHKQRATGEGTARVCRATDVHSGHQNNLGPPLAARTLVASLIMQLAVFLGSDGDALRVIAPNLDVAAWGRERKSRGPVRGRRRGRGDKRPDWACERGTYA